MSIRTEQSRVLARIAMRYGLLPSKALPIASAWVSSQVDRTWHQLEQALDAGTIIIRREQLVELSDSNNSSSPAPIPEPKPGTPLRKKPAVYFRGRIVE